MAGFKQSSLIIIAASTALTVLAVFDQRFALFSCMFTFVALLVYAHTSWRSKTIWALAVLFNVVLFAKFIVSSAVPGVIAGGQRASARGAVSHLREIVFAQNIARERGLVDTDGDGIGEALTMPELTTGELRNGKAISPLIARYQPTDNPQWFDINGYRYTVWLPRRDNRPDHIPRPPSFVAGGEIRNMDAEHAERRFIAYAWPVAKGAGTSIIAIDEHERIVWSESPRTPIGAAGPPLGTALAPLIGRKDSVFAEDAEGEAGNMWRAWKSKRPTVNLIGDK